MHFFDVTLFKKIGWTSNLLKIDCSSIFKNICFENEKL